MSRFARISIYTLAALALPAAAVVLGLRSLEQRDHPDAPIAMDTSAVAKVPRPPIDPTKPTVVVLLGADLTEITDALGPYEMFARARRYNVITAAPKRQPTLLTGGIRILPHYSLAELNETLGRAADIVVVPNLPNADAPMNRPVIDWIRRQAAAGSLIHSWCKGAMALAETGLLDGHTATAHWGDIPTLEKRYPRVTWVRGVRWIDRGQFVMSAGITSGIDASLRVLIRVAGDSVARRVAREIRYPNYHFALDPNVEQYALRPADLVLLANAAFRMNRPLMGVGMYDGVGEFDLSNVYDAHVHTLAVRVETVAETASPVVTEHGLTMYPSLTLASADERNIARARELDRLIVPGPEAPKRATALAAAAAARVPKLRPEYVHAAQPGRFGLEAIIEDLARIADVPTARFALKRMEYRSATIRFQGPYAPWAPLSVVIALAVGGVAAAVGAVKVARALSESDRKSSAATLTGSERSALPWRRRQQERLVSR
jgi:AraC family transcriptional regulator, transcriptional activator FtrA